MSGCRPRGCRHGGDPSYYIIKPHGPVDGDNALRCKLPGEDEYCSTSTTGTRVRITVWLRWVIGRMILCVLIRGKKGYISSFNGNTGIGGLDVNRTCGASKEC